MAFTARSSAAEAALTSVVDALARVRALGRLADSTVMARADEALRLSIDAAVEAGHSWGAIGECLGIARGNAYQKYRRPPLRATPKFNAPPL